MKYLFIILLFFFISCEKEENLKIINQNLVLELKSFIKEVDENSPCKSDYITIRISENEIKMANYQPELSEDFIGMIEFDKSKIYLFSSNDYSNYVKVIYGKKKEKEKKLESKESCDPPMYRILLIDKRDKNKFRIVNIEK